MKEYKINEISYKRILGRNVKDAGNTDKPLALFWAASALEINVKSSEVWIQVSSKSNSCEPWIAIEVNNQPVSRFIAPEEPQWICIAKHMNVEKENLVTVMKDIQPMPDDLDHSLLVHKIGLSDNGSFVPLKERPLNIEFVGDSITSGEGLCGGPDEWDWIPQWMSASKNYAVKVAHSLNANWNLFSQCGWGICWGWDGNRNSVMPPHYENVCSIMKGNYQASLGVKEPYVSPYKNDFVIVNLGTNDNGAFSQQPWKDENGVEYVLHSDSNGKALKEDGMIVANGVRNFLKTIRKNNPSAKIIWTWGMIKLTTIPEYILMGIDEYKKETGDNQVYSVELDAMEDVEKLPEDKGSRGHPGPKTHRLAAEKLIELIEKIK